MRRKAKTQLKKKRNKTPNHKFNLDLQLQLKKMKKKKTNNKMSSNNLLLISNHNQQLWQKMKKIKKLHLQSRMLVMSLLLHQVSAKPHSLLKITFKNRQLLSNLAKIKIHNQHLAKTHSTQLLIIMLIKEHPIHLLNLIRNQVR